jgi:very-short-patch-repair endonuclease
MESRDFDLKVYEYLTSFIQDVSPPYIIESPIEKYLFIQIIRLSIAENLNLTGSPFNGIFPQHKVTINDTLYYLVDFVFHTHAKHKIAVELDGYEFHEKTKDQAQADKEKDRNLQQAGYFVARFTGSEVYADPREILFKIMDIARDLDREEKAI